MTHNYKFELSKEQIKKLEEWQDTLPDVYTGAIGGRYQYIFTPTGLGDALTVKDLSTKQVINLTEYDLW